MTVYTIFGIVAAIAFVLALIRFVLKRPPNILITFLQDFVGAFFIFSGFVKAVDPLGTSYKMHEYYEAFAQDGLRPFWDFLANFSTLSAIIMIATELFIGFMLLIGWRPKLTIGIIWLLTLFFTFLTGYTYLSGYCISKAFLVLSGIILLIFASVAFPQNKSARNNLTFIAIGFLAIFFVFSKLSGQMLQCGFTEANMKVTDCGCFGDFIKLKPWETFYKDCVLDVIILILVLNSSLIIPLFHKHVRNALAGLVGAAALFFCLYNTYWSEPVIDFRPYAIGNNIPDLMKEKVPPKVAMLYHYHNKATGKWEDITMEQVMNGKVDYSKYDTSYREDKVLDPGIPARILGLNIYNDNGDDVTDSLLSYPGYAMVVVSANLNKTHEAAFKQLNAIAAGCDKIGVKFYAIVANNGHVDEFRHENDTAYPFYTADETPVKTIMRSNPGLLLLKDGTVVNKWHYMHLPTFEELNTEYFSKK